MTFVTIATAAMTATKQKHAQQASGANKGTNKTFDVQRHCFCCLAAIYFRPFRLLATVTEVLTRSPNTSNTKSVHANTDNSYNIKNNKNNNTNENDKWMRLSHNNNLSLNAAFVLLIFLHFPLFCWQLPNFSKQPHKALGSTFRDFNFYCPFSSIHRRSVLLMPDSIDARRTCVRLDCM